MYPSFYGNATPSAIQDSTGKVYVRSRLKLPILQFTVSFVFDYKHIKPSLEVTRRFIDSNRIPLDDKAPQADNCRMKRLLVIAAVALIVTSTQAQARINDPSCKGALHGIAITEENQRVVGVNLVLYPIGVDLGYVLPTTITNVNGEYRFEHICEGRFTVLVQDESAGYAMPLWYFLLGRFHEVMLTPEHALAEVHVDVPPKAALFQVAVRNRSTKAPLSSAEVMFKFVNHKNFGWLRFNYRSGDVLLVPSNTELLCRINSASFSVWKGGNRKGKIVKLPPERRFTLEAELAPKRG